MDTDSIKDIKARLARGHSPLEIAKRMKIDMETVMLLRAGDLKEPDARPDLTGVRSVRSAGKTDIAGAPIGWLMTEAKVDALLRRCRVDRA